MLEAGAYLSHFYNIILKVSFKAGCRDNSGIILHIHPGKLVAVLGSSVKSMLDW